ncbi:unnamed protein product [Urochloa humidicola]
MISGESANNTMCLSWRIYRRAISERANTLCMPAGRGAWLAPWTVDPAKVTGKVKQAGGVGMVLCNAATRSLLLLAVCQALQLPCVRSKIFPRQKERKNMICTFLIDHCSHQADH